MDTEHNNTSDSLHAGQPLARKAAKTLKLITKLLAKAESTPFPAEAQAFQEHAERLMVRYGIEQASVDAEAGKEGKPREAMVEERVEFSGQYRVGQARGFSHIAAAFGSVTVLQATTPTRKLLYLIGAESDVGQILRLFASLRVQMATAMTVWWLGYDLKDFLTAHEKTLERRQFQWGFLSTVAQRIKHIHGSEVAAGSPGSSLVLVNRRDRAEQHARELYPEVRRGRNQALSAGSRDAHSAGVVAGTTAAVNGQVVESRRPSLRT